MSLDQEARQQLLAAYATLNPEGVSEVTRQRAEEKQALQARVDALVAQRDETKHSAHEKAAQIAMQAEADLSRCTTGEQRRELLKAYGNPGEIYTRERNRLLHSGTYAALSRDIEDLRHAIEEITRLEDLG